MAWKNYPRTGGFQSLGEPDGEVAVFNRSAALAERWHWTESELLRAHEKGDTPVALSKANTLILDIAPLIKRKRIAIDDGKEKRPAFEVMKELLNEARAHYEQSLQANTPNNKLHYKKKAHEIIEKLIINLRQASFDTGYDFRKEVDPLDAWAEG